MNRKYKVISLMKYIRQYVKCFKYELEVKGVRLRPQSYSQTKKIVEVCGHRTSEEVIEARALTRCNRLDVDIGM